MYTCTVCKAEFSPNVLFTSFEEMKIKTLPENSVTHMGILIWKYFSSDNWDFWYNLKNIVYGMKDTGIFSDNTNVQWFFVLKKYL